MLGIYRECEGILEFVYIVENSCRKNFPIENIVRGGPVVLQHTGSEKEKEINVLQPASF